MGEGMEYLSGEWERRIPGAHKKTLKYSTESPAEDRAHGFAGDVMCLAAWCL